MTVGHSASTSPHRSSVIHNPFAIAVKLLVMLLGVIGMANLWNAVFADVGVALLCVLNSLRLMRISSNHSL